MRIKIFLKKFLSISVAAVMASTLVGCFDLGDFSDEAAYYDAFGDVGLVYQNPDSEEKDVERDNYSVEDYFYNKNTGEDFTYGNPEDDEPDEGKNIPQLSYVYMVVPVKQNMTIESIGLFLNATRTCSLEIIFYVVDSLPDDGSFKNVRLLGYPEYQQKQDGEGNPMFDADGSPIYQEKVDEYNNPLFDEFGNPIYVEKIYSDPLDSKIVGRTTASLKAETWSSFLIEKWASGKAVAVKKGQYLLMRFVNNSGLNEVDKTPVSFRTTNLLIRAIF